MRTTALRILALCTCLGLLACSEGKKAEPSPTEKKAEKAEKAEPSPTETKAEPSPTETKAEPSPTETKAEPSPTETKAEPSPTETKAEPEKKAEEKPAEQADTAAKNEAMKLKIREELRASSTETRLKKEQAKAMVAERSIAGVLGSQFGEGGGGAGMLSAGSPGTGGPSVGMGRGFKGGMLMDGGPGLGSITSAPTAVPPVAKPTEDPGRDDYKKIDENEYKKALEEPLSTFSIDVDTASYANVRRFLNNGRLPPKDAVRIEEMVNYFGYDYAEPTDDRPFAVHAKITDCPWEPKHRLARIALQGRKVKTEDLPPSNLVFLLDVSGSMRSRDKLPLLKAGLTFLLEEMRPTDRVAIVVYAGAAGLVLPSTPGTEKTKILGAMDGLRAGGSTAGGQGIKLAYKIAKENFIEGGNNRVILGTDGDFNVGTSSHGALVRLIEEKRKDKIFLTVLGFGRGNLMDSRMEALADKGNGNYSYIDSVKEAKRVLSTEFAGTLFAIAKDVKLQIEFNPTKVAEYRLIGYENRVMAKEDFDDDKKDAGELGSGHRVTAFYELVPASGEEKGTETKYTKTAVKPGAETSNELMTVKLRYKQPDQDKSTKFEVPVLDKNTPFAKTDKDLQFAAAVAAFGMVLRDSKYKGSLTYKLVKELAQPAIGEDESGYRKEFMGLVDKAIEGPRVEAPLSPRDLAQPRKVRIRAGNISDFAGGKVDQTALRRLIRRRQVGIKRCYQKSLQTNPTAKGKLIIGIEVAPNGRAKAKTLTNTTGDNTISQCIQKRIRRWLFPKAEDKKPYSFKVPIVMTTR